MKKVVILEQPDYNELLNVLKDLGSSVKSMRKSFTRDHLMYLTDKAIDILQREDGPDEPPEFHFDKPEIPEEVGRYGQRITRRY